MTRRSKKHKVVAISSVEPKFLAITKEITDVLWIRKLLTELEFQLNRNCELNCDNKAAITYQQNLTSTS